MRDIALIALAELTEGVGHECVVAREPEDLRIVLIRQGDAVLAYENRCPHFSLPLNFEPNRFWIYDGTTLMCAHHAAMFNLADGTCFDGPCKGAPLHPITTHIEDGIVYQRVD